MRNDILTADSVEFDFGEGYGVTWDIVYPDFDSAEREELDRIVSYYDVQTDHLDEFDPDEWDGDREAFEDERTEELRTELREFFEGDGFDSLAPMMNFLYPTPADHSGGELARLALDTCFTLVNVGGVEYFALTGGGMDMRWEMCAAWVSLGSLPPVEFAELPRMAGRGESESDLALIGHCIAAFRMARDWHERAAQRMVSDFLAD